RRIAPPGAAKGRAGEIGWDAAREKRRDIGLCSDRIDRRQRLEIERRILRRESFWLRRYAVIDAIASCEVGRSWQLRLRLFGGIFSLAARPTRQEIFRVAHSPCSFTAGARRANACGSARSRLRLTKACS